MNTHRGGALSLAGGAPDHVARLEAVIERAWDAGTAVAWLKPVPGKHGHVLGWNQDGKLVREESSDLHALADWAGERWPP